MSKFNTMKICILNGNPNQSNTAFEQSLAEIKNKLTNYHQVQEFVLRNMEIKSCTGCFGCWVKKPGECLFADDTIQIRESVIHSDLVLFTSPIIMGFSSALLKLTQDKLIPLLLPYIDLIHRECHHQKRYKKYPNMGVVYQMNDQTEQEDIEIMKEIYDRFAINFHSKNIVFHNIENNPEDIIHAININ